MRLRPSIAAALIAGTCTAFATELPPRKPGLWELTTTHENAAMPPQTMQHCTDSASDRTLLAMGTALASSFCSRQEIRQEGNAYVIEAVCKMGPLSVSSTSIISGDFNSAYTIKMTPKIEGIPPQLAALAGGGSTTTARWVGACKDGQTPGDIVMPDGRTMNIMNLQEMLGGSR
jgi:hypothetical protein